MTAKIHKHIENPTDSFSDTLDKYGVVRLSWADFRTISYARESLDPTKWEALEGLAVKKLLEELVPEEDETFWGTLLMCFPT